ncbi:tetratricopeptide repeat protein [Hyphobacterium sp. CCMP332]|nr:tetratricopeptide repeat protein [Hyphobacterium sp. CCMP332]
MEKSKRRLAAIMFTDMVGYTALVQENEKEAKKRRERHRATQKNATEKFNGNILQYFGDGTLIVFDSAVDAVLCAIEIQTELSKAPSIPLRIGIHTGDVVIEDDGIFGDGVNLASRIETFCKPGAVFISNKVHDEVKNQNEIRTRYLGPFEFKNVKKPIDIFAIVDDNITVPDVKDYISNRADKVKSIAVLPFVNMSHEKENEYFSDGISEEVLNALTRIKGLKVTSRTSSFAFKNSKEDIKSIGKTLNVNTILEGSVRRSGKKVRITAQLINTEDDYHYWSETFNRELLDIFEIQDEIAEKIASKLQSEIDEDRSPGENSAHVKNMDSYKSYLQGMHHFYKFTPEDAKKAIKQFKEAIAIDPEYGPSYAAYASCLTYLGSIGQMKPKEVFPQAESMAVKAIKLSPENSLSYVAIGIINLFYKWNFPKAKSYFEQAIEVNPSSSEPYTYLGWYYLMMENFTKHLEYQQKAYDLNPMSIQNLMYLAQAYFVSKDYENARSHYRKILEMEPSTRGAYEGLAWIELANENYDKAIEYFKKYRSFLTDPLKGWTGLGFAYGKAGYTKEAIQALENTHERLKNDDSISLDVDFAIINAGLGRMDEAFNHLKNALKNRLGGIIFLKINPIWEFVRKDKRFHEIIKEFNESVIE